MSGTQSSIPRIVVIGGGIAGLATAWSLARARQKCEIVLIEREHTIGIHSSGRSASILRTAIPDEPMRRLAEETRTFLNAPPTGFSKSRLLQKCGLIVVTDERTDPAWLREELEVRELSREQLATLAPHYRMQGGRALYLPQEGRIDTEELLASLARGAVEAGAKLRMGQTVESLIHASGEVRGVRLATGESLHADWTVIAAGGWAARLGNQAGSQQAFTPTRRHIVVSKKLAGIDPHWPIVWDDGGRFYARPEDGGWLLCTCDETEIDPDRCEIVPAVQNEILSASTKYLRGFPGGTRASAESVRHFWAGMRTFGPDKRSVIGPDPDVGGLFWVAGLGGHGITTSIGTGSLAAALLLGADAPGASAFSPAGRAPVSRREGVDGAALDTTAKTTRQSATGRLG